MRKSPWHDEPLSGPEIRALAVNNMRIRLDLLIILTGPAIVTAVVGPLTSIPEALYVLTAACMLFGARPVVLGFPKFLQQWRSLRDGHRSLGMTDVSYATLWVESALVAVPVILASWLIFIAIRGF